MVLDRRGLVVHAVGSYNGRNGMTRAPQWFTDVPQGTSSSTSCITEVMKVVAVDWSGRASLHAQREHIWAATAEDGVLVSLANGKSRQDVVDSLKEKAEADPRFVVGLDFAFSFPAWYLLEKRIPNAYGLWCRLASEGEHVLRVCEPPFWGRSGTRKPTFETAFRRTESGCPPVSGIRPKSVFQLYGPGAVGAGSLRGMPCLRELHDAGFAVWPFDHMKWPRVVEIYPRALTGSVVKSSRASRQGYLRSWKLNPALRRLAESSEDAFDAAVSALAMSRHASELEQLVKISEFPETLEGAIWLPPRLGQEGG
jgi:hypothetical protein